jgi:hypothetical protein
MIWNILNFFILCKMLKTFFININPNYHVIFSFFSNLFKFVFLLLLYKMYISFKILFVSVY